MAYFLPFIISASLGFARKKLISNCPTTFDTFQIRGKIPNLAQFYKSDKFKGFVEKTEFKGFKKIANDHRLKMSDIV